MKDPAPAFGLIGSPISHSLSPALFEAAYGGRMAYDLIETGSFEDAWTRFLESYRAVNVTMPFKALAAARTINRSEEVRAIGAANILVKTDLGVAAYNSDVMAVRNMLSSCPAGSKVAIIGSGGAGKAAQLAANSLFSRVFSRHHDEIAGGVSADVIIYTLPCAVPGYDKLDCDVLIEANYKNPCLEGHPGYISGKRWLLEQAICGFGLMTGEKPDAEAMKKVF